MKSQPGIGNGLEHVEGRGRIRGQFAKLSYGVVGSLILLVMFGLAVHSMVEKSPTFDEQGFITRGLGYLRGENRHMRVGHPLGLNALSAMFLVGDESVVLPIDDPSWEGTNFHRPSELFLWEIGNDVAKVMFLARLPTVFLGMLLAALAGRFAGQMAGSIQRGSGRLAGLLAMFLIGLDPNILAHMRLATTDLGLAAGAMLAGYLVWRFFKRPSWRRAILAGVGFGLLQDTKFTAGLFVPLLGLVMGVGVVHTVVREKAGRMPALRRVLPLVVAFPAAAFLTLWAAYGFDVGTLPESLPTFSELGGRTLPLAHHLEQLLDIGGRMQKSTPSFLLGNYSDRGWWYYFPVAFLVKTPLPTLILLVSAVVVFVVRLIKGRQEASVRSVKGRFAKSSYKGNLIVLKGERAGLGLVDLAALLIPAVGYFGIALTSEINLGYRHLLPVLPFLVVFVAAVLVPAMANYRWGRYGLAFFIVWLMAATLWISPDFLAFFNVLGGGPDNGWRVLVDSNLDWGQDLAGLKGWMDENGVEEVWLSYFGEARPDYYGIAYRGLASNPPRLMNPVARPFYPEKPAPGIYAISATTLQGVHFDNHDLFAWFREREPLAKIGYSIFLYDVPEDGERVDAALGNIQLDEIALADFEELGSNDIVPHWFDPLQALLITGGRDSAVLVPPGNSFSGLLAELVEKNYTLAYSGQSVTILKPNFEERSALDVLFNQDWITWQREQAAVFTEEDNQIILHGYAIPDTTLVPGGSLVVLTLSERATASVADPAPVKMFLHLTAADGQITTQWDGLGVVWQSWMAGDLLIQQHVLTLPDGLAHGEFQLWAGFYNPDELTRWRAQPGNVEMIPLEVLTFQ